MRVNALLVPKQARPRPQDQNHHVVLHIKHGGRVCFGGIVQLPQQRSLSLTSIPLVAQSFGNRAQSASRKAFTRTTLIYYLGIIISLAIILELSVKLSFLPCSKVWRSFVSWLALHHSVSPRRS
jgi:hypothetical protein